LLLLFFFLKWYHLLESANGNEKNENAAKNETRKLDNEIKTETENENENDDDDDVDPAPLEDRVPMWWWMSGLVVSSVFTIAVLIGLWKIVWYGQIM
jgi:hypothetical protein